MRHAPPNGKDRSHLVAQLSDDDGRSWGRPLMLDERLNVSYPDGVEGEGGKIYVVYDRERFTRRVIERILTQFESLGSENLDYLLRKLSEFGVSDTVAKPAA